MGFKQDAPETGIGVKKANVVEQVSKDVYKQRLQCLARSMKDIVWWAENFFRIMTVDKGLTTIKLYPKQKEMLKFLVDNTRIISCASRQVGKTTTYTVFCLWLATLFKDKRILICANKLATAIEIMNRIRKAYEELPFWIKPGIISYAKGGIEFANGSSIKAFSTSSSGCRGASCNVLCVDEMSFIPKNIIDEFWASVVPIVSSSKNSKIIIVSTPNGASGKYYELWQAANSKEVGGNKEGWQPFRINWWEVPGRDEEWKAQRIASEGMQVWKQEYECDFLTSSSIHKLIPDEVIQRYRQKQAELKTSGASVGKKQTIMAESGDKLYEFTVWHEFKKNHTYLASGDISEGVGGDSSVLYVWDVTDLSNITQCAKFASNTVSVVEFAFVISRILKLYNNPYFVAERNGISGGTLDALRITYNYPRLVREGKGGEPGFYSHVTTKGKACLWAKEMFNTEGFGFTFYDTDILDEADTFVKKDTQGVHVVYHALPPTHDDFIMSLIWMCYILKNEFVEKYFQVQEAFRSANDVVYAKRLAPLQDYTAAELKSVTDDPLYKQYLEFKEEMHATLKDVLKRVGNQDEDQFGFSNRNEDPYFGGFDDSPSWNAPNLQLPPSQLGSSDSRPPQFYFSGGCGFSQF